MEIKCDYCDKEFNYKEGLNHFNRRKNHYCSLDCLSKSKITHNMASYKNGKNKRYKMWESAKKRAKLKNIEFNIEPIDIPEIPKYCPVLNIEIKSNITHSPLDSSPSLDRIDNNKGYIKGNIRIVSNRVNRIKSNATLDELKLIVKDLEQYEKISN